jgi:hypothetical protein
VLELKDATSFYGEPFVAEVDDALTLIGRDAAGVLDVASAYGPSSVIYVASECLEKPQGATAQADVCGLGMTAIFCLSGRELSLEALRNLDPTVAALACSDRIRGVLRRAVAWEPHARFADTRAMVAQLRYALDQQAIEDTRNSRAMATAYDPRADYYAILSIGGSATAEDIKRAHRARIAEIHPDRGGDSA